MLLVALPDAQVNLLALHMVMVALSDAQIRPLALNVVMVTLPNIQAKLLALLNKSVCLIELFSISGKSM